MMGLVPLQYRQQNFPCVSYAKKPQFSPGLNHADILFLNFQPLDQSGKNKC